MRNYNITKYKGNTHYTVNVTDSFGQEHHLGYYNKLTPEIMSEIEADAEMLWENEVEQEVCLLDKAIANCVKLDINRGVEPKLD